jgi:hypothetical protein
VNRNVLSLFPLAAATALVLSATVPTAGYAAPPKKPAANPAAKRAASGPIVLGTTQMPGDFGKFGQTYTVGKSTPINFTLDSARYAAERFTIGPNIWVPKRDEKVLVLRFTVHNPLPRTQRFYWADLKFTAVDATDTNREYIQAVRRAGVQDARFEAELKPAQKVQIETAIVVPAAGEVPKLIVEREAGAPVIRYDLRGKVGKLPAPFADPADATGATPAKEPTFAAGTPAPVGAMDVTLEAVGSIAGPAYNGDSPKPGYRYATVLVTLKNVTAAKRRYYWGDFDATARDADGEKVPFTQSMLKGTRNEKADGELEPGESVRVRFYFAVPESVQLKTVTLRDTAYSGVNGRPVVFDLTGAPAAPEAAGQ